MLTDSIANQRSEFIRYVESFASICVFRHQNPDGDAQGSQFGMVHWLKEHYPEKSIYALGFHQGTHTDFYPPCDVVEDYVIAASLAIILDTANVERIDDQRYQNAKAIVKIDHHPGDMNYGTFNLIHTDYTSACEIVSDLLKTDETVPFSYEVAHYLYSGLLTDTLRFSIKSVTTNTLLVAAYLSSSGIDISGINAAMFSMTRAEFELSTYLRANCQVTPEGLVYLILDDAKIREIGLAPKYIKSRISDFSNVIGFEIWVMFLELYEDDGQLAWSGSMRSKERIINDIAFKHGGGGHPLACAVKNLPYSEVEVILEELNQKLI